MSWPKTIIELTEDMITQKLTGRPLNEKGWRHIIIQAQDVSMRIMLFILTKRKEELDSVSIKQKVK